jgi:hypothetical protein
MFWEKRRRRRGCAGEERRERKWCVGVGYKISAGGRREQKGWKGGEAECVGIQGRWCHRTRAEQEGEIAIACGSVWFEARSENGL